jgi:DNA-binding PadR family transcriptional regulator
MTTTQPKTGPGSQMGVKTRAILECLRKNGRKNRLDLEMMLNIGQLRQSLNRLCSTQYVNKCTHGSATGCYEITRLGRIALGESIEIPRPKEIRICAATTSGHYTPAIHSISRIGLARA